MILTQSGQPSRGIHMVVRTLKQKAYAGTSRAESGENRRREKEQGLSRQVGMMALWALVGLVVSRASIYGGMAPFGVGVAAAVDGGAGHDEPDQRPERHEGDLPDRLPPQGLFPPCRNAGFHGLSTCGIGFSPGVCFLFQHPHHH